MKKKNTDEYRKKNIVSSIPISLPIWHLSGLTWYAQAEFYWSWKYPQDSSEYLPMASLLAHLFFQQLTLRAYSISTVGLDKLVDLFRLKLPHPSHGALESSPLPFSFVPSASSICDHMLDRVN